MNPRFALILTLCALVAITTLSGCGAAQQREEEVAERADYHFQLATGYFSANEMPSAISELLMAIELQPDHEGALFMLGFIYQGRMDYPMAEEYYLLAHEANPSMLEIQNNLGTVYLEQERWEEAETIFRELTRTPTYQTPGHAHNNLGWALYNLGQIREARDQFEMATLFQPDLCLAYNNKGLAEEALGNHRDARRAYETAVNRCDSYPEPRYRLGVLLLNSGGDPFEANELFQACYDLMPESTFGQRCLEYLSITRRM